MHTQTYINTRTPLPSPIPIESSNAIKRSPKIVRKAFGGGKDKKERIQVSTTWLGDSSWHRQHSKPPPPPPPPHPPHPPPPPPPPP